MAIAPPSDIVLDVAQAADPLRLQAATSKLARLAAGSAAASDSFDIHVQSAGDGKPAATPLAATTRFADSPVIRSQVGSPYQKFEAMVLQSFVENILPKDENLFGDAASADMCRSMLAEQLATQLAKGGSLGIARLIKNAHPPEHLAAATLPGPAPAAPPAQSGALAGAAADRWGAATSPAPRAPRQGDAS